jgi:hypothetical protein
MWRGEWKCVSFGSEISFFSELTGVTGMYLLLVEDTCMCSSGRKPMGVSGTSKLYSMLG